MPAGMSARPAARRTNHRVGSFLCCDQGDTPAWVNVDVRGDEGTPVEDLTQLAEGVMVSIDCYHIGPFGTAGLRYRHYGVYIGQLTQNKFRQIKDCDPILMGRHSVVHLYRDRVRERQSVVRIDDRQLFEHTGSDAADAGAIVEKAIGEIGRSVRYDVKEYNCERFASWCTRGIKRSDQAENAEEIETWGKKTALAVVFTGALFMLAKKTFFDADNSDDD